MQKPDQALLSFFGISYPLQKVSAFQSLKLKLAYQLMTLAGL
jgi:hypothetical protein